MPKHELVSPEDDALWTAYHAIRRRVLFEDRGRFGVYDEHRSDETAPGNHPKVLLHNGDAVGAIRIDINGSTAIFRRVAIRSDVQRLGHGRALLRLAEHFAKAIGCDELESNVARDAVDFYEKCGFSVAEQSSPGESILMRKRT